MTPAQRDYLLKEEHDALVKTHGAADGFRGNQYVKVVNGQNGQLPNSSGEMFQARKVVAKEHGIKESEVRRAVEFGRGLDEAEKVSPGIKEAVLSGSVKTPKSIISEIRNAPEEKKREAVEAIKKGDADTAKHKNPFIFCRIFKRLFFCCGYSGSLKGGVYPSPLSPSGALCYSVSCWPLWCPVRPAVLWEYPPQHYHDSKDAHRPLQGQAGHKESRGVLVPGPSYNK